MVEETRALLQRTSIDLKDARRALDRERDSRRRWTAALIVVVIVSALFTWRFVDYSNCSTGRQKALTGPSSDRVSYLLNAIRVSAGGPVDLNTAQRHHDLDILDQARDRYQKIPSRENLQVSPDSKIVLWVDLVAALDAQTTYDNAVMHHPVCSLW